MATGAITTELRGAGGSGGSSASGGAGTAACGDSQSIAFRLIRNDAAITTTPITIVFGRIGRRIIPPDRETPDLLIIGKGKDAPVRRAGVRVAAFLGRVPFG